MEKFGIFELLDALSALTAQNEGNKPAPDDASYRPPDYAAPVSPKQERNPDSPGTEEGGEALSAFLARHDAIVRKIDEKKK